MKTFAVFVIALALRTFEAPAQTYTCAHGANPLTATTRYRPTAAGFDLAPAPALITGSGCSSDRPFFVSFPLAEGSYRVTVDLGVARASVTSVRAEARRLMLANVATAAGKYRTETFTVNLRRPEIPDGEEVKRKPREMRSLDWDEKLTLSFTGEHPGFRSIRIEPVPANTVTVYLAGDSTVVDQENEPWAAWGQMLPAFFSPEVVIANHAESGETIQSFESERRFAKIFSLIHAGDYLFLQFAHNDQKPGRGFVSTEAYAALLRKYIGEARSRGETPVLVTSMNRRTFDATGRITDSLAPYPQTMRQVAATEHVTLIDLNAMSKTLYEAVGEAESRELFVYAPPNTYPGQAEALHDDTHFNSFGALELAKCIALGIARSDLPLKQFLRPGASAFDPSRPDAPAAVVLPPTPFTDTETPYER